MYGAQCRTANHVKQQICTHSSSPDGWGLLVTPDAQEQEFRVSSDHSLKYIAMYPRQGLRCFFPLQGKCQWKIRALIASLEQTSLDEILIWSIPVVIVSADGHLQIIFALCFLQ